MNVFCKALAGVALAAMTTAAKADIVTVIWTGSVYSGYDNLGVFGAGLDLTGLAYKAVYKFDTNLGLYTTDPTSAQVSGNAPNSPSLGASITINGITFHSNGNWYSYLTGYADTTSSYIANYTYDQLGLSSSWLYTSVARNDRTFPNSITTPLFYSTAFGDNAQGEFAIIQSANYVVHADLRNFETVALSVNVTSGVPEPSTWAMMLAGFCGLAVAGRRKMAAA